MLYKRNVFLFFYFFIFILHLKNNFNIFPEEIIPNNYNILKTKRQMDLEENFKINLVSHIGFNNKVVELYHLINDIEELDNYLLNDSFGESIMTNFYEKNTTGISNFFMSNEKKKILETIDILFRTYKALQDILYNIKSNLISKNKLDTNPDSSYFKLFIESAKDKEIIKELKTILFSLRNKMRIRNYISYFKSTFIYTGLTFGSYKLFNYLYDKIFNKALANKVDLNNKNIIKFKDVGGYKLIKEEISKIMNLVKNNETYNNLLKIPKGVIFYGPPGTGKTYLARAIAGEFEINFLNVSVSEIASKWVGESAKNVVSLFEKARKLAPCILFIDEADTLLSRRGTSHNMEDITQEFLKQIDGFDTIKGIYVILNTNRLEAIDPAILRSGRIEEHFYIGLPLYKERIDIIKKIIEKLKLIFAKDITIEYLANKLDGKSPADIDSLFNKLLINNLAAKKKDPYKFTLADFDNIYKDKFYGLVSDFEYKESDLVSTAYHEAGHAYIMLTNNNYPFVFDSLTIVPRGEFLGVAMATKGAEKTSYTYDEYISLVDTFLAGRAAEEIILNKKMSGATSDLDKAKELLEHAFHDGMGKKIVYNNEDERNNDIAELIEERYKIVKNIIEKNKEKLKEIVQLLLVKKTLFKADIIDIINAK